MDLRTLATQFITYSANETDAQGNRRAGSTISQYRRAMEGFVAAAEALNGGILAQLPETFVEREWMQTQQSIIEKPVQLRVRAASLKMFYQWCSRNNIACPPFKWPKIETPPRKPKPPVEVQPMNDVTGLGDFMNPDPVPSTTTNNVVPMQAPAQMPQAAQPPQAAPKRAQPVGSGRPANPLAGMLPSSSYKLRVRRERELDDPVWVADFAAERVTAHGAIEPFLGREVAPRLALQGLSGDVTFLVSAVGPTGNESERNRVTVSIPAAPLPQATPAVSPVGTMPMVTPGLGADITDVLAYHRKAQEELEDRLAKRIEQTQAAKPAPAPVQETRVQRNDELDDLKRMMGQLASSVQSLASRMEERENRYEPSMMAPPPAPAPVAPQLDVLSVIKEVVALTSKPTPPAPAPVQQPMGMAEMFNMMVQAKQMFAPAQVNIDVSPLEERLEAVQQELAATKKKGQINEMVEQMKSMKELMGLMGMGDPNTKKDTSLGGALGSLVEKIVSDPEPIASAVERILGATAMLKGTATPPPQQAQQKRDPVPPQLRKATDELIAAQGDAAIVAAGYEWVTALGRIEQTRKLADKLTALLRMEKANELTVYMKQILTHFGYADTVPLARLQTIAATLVEQVRKVNAQADDEEVSDEEEGQPDLTVRVGSVNGYGRADDESEDEGEEEEPSEDEDQDEEDAAAEEQDENSAEAGEDEAASEPAPEPKPRRKRRTKAEMEAARAAEAAVKVAAQEQQNVAAVVG